MLVPTQTIGNSCSGCRTARDGDGQPGRLRHGRSAPWRHGASLRRPARPAVAGRADGTPAGTGMRARHLGEARGPARWRRVMPDQHLGVLCWPPAARSRRRLAAGLALALELRTSSPKSGPGRGAGGPVRVSVRRDRACGARSRVQVAARRSKYPVATSPISDNCSARRSSSLPPV